MLNAYQVHEMARRGLSEDFLEACGVTSVDEVPDEFLGHPYAVTPALLFPRTNLDGSILLQLRPDEPVNNEEGDPVKYVFPTGSPMSVTRLREVGGAAIIVEGTCQSLAVLRYAPTNFSVYGIEGCWNWRNGALKIPARGLEVFENRRVIIALDADSASNRSVYDAGIALKDALMAEGASEILFMRLPGSSGSAGIDDALGDRTEHLRGPYLARQISKATAKPADVKPNKKRSGSKPPPDKVVVQATDLDVSDAWLERYGHNLRFNVDLQKWMAYVEGTWSVNAGISLAQASFQDCIRHDIVAVTNDSGSEVVAREWLYSAKRLETVLKQGAANKAYQLSDDVMDTDPWLWNARNMVINLRTGQPRDHRPDDYMSQQSPVDFDPFARAPKFQEWLSEVLPNVETRKYVQRLLGQAMVGQVLEHIFPVFIGTGRNGKGTLLRLVAEVFGPYFTGLKKTVLVDTKFETHATALATLHRKRLAATEEMKATAAYDVALIKSLTGGDHITANKMRQDDIVFKPAHTLLLASNHRPKVDQNELAFWARYREIPFNAWFENPSDAVEQAMKTPEELSGILNWLLEGLADYRHNGLGEPEEVMWASAAAKVEADPLYDFIEEYIARTGDEGDKIEAKSVRERYESFCQKKHVEPIRVKGFREAFAAASGSELKKIRLGDRAGVPVYLRIRWATDEDVDLSEGFVDSNFSDQSTFDTTLELHKLSFVDSVDSVDTKKAHISYKGKTCEDPKDVSHRWPIEENEKSTSHQISEKGPLPAETPVLELSTKLASSSTPVGFGLKYWEDLGAEQFEPPVCEHCDTVYCLVPPGNFWYACPTCFPSTFARD